MISKKLGPDVWIPIQMVTWSVIGIAQGFITGEKTFYATRALLGLVEGGFIPDAILYLSYFYKNTEMPVRMSYFYCSSHATFIVAAFLAFGILHSKQLLDTLLTPSRSKFYQNVASASKNLSHCWF
jgi:MFS family permease